MLETVLWIGFVLGAWAALIVACVKGWAGAVVLITCCIVALHFVVTFGVISNAFCTIVYLRKHILGRESYFESLPSA
jgi:hypothetical protein